VVGRADLPLESRETLKDGASGKACGVSTSIDGTGVRGGLEEPKSRTLPVE
jgi:hypothetical protein